MLSAQNKEINSKTAQKEQISKAADEAELQIKQLDHTLNKLKQEAKDSENRVRFYYFYLSSCKICKFNKIFCLL